MDWSAADALAAYALVSVVMCVGFVVGAWWAGRRD